MLALALWLLTTGASAQDEAPVPTEAEPAADAPADKPYQIAALPIANYSSVTGVGYGAYAAVVRNAEAGSDDPYRWRVAVQAFFTTGRYMDHYVLLDVPSVYGSPYRWDLLVGYESWAEANWFGVGNDQPLLPADAIEDELYLYDVQWFRGLTNLRRDIGGPWDVFGQYLLRVAAVDAYEGSLLASEQPLGMEGGNYARIGAGLMFDTRNAEPSPTAGAFSEVSVRASHPVVGSRYRVVGLNITDRRWVALDKGERLIFASRAIVDLRRGDEPFWMTPLLGSSQFVELGGANNLRGLPWGRYRGDAVLLWTPELRWKAVSPGPADLWIVPFFDVGRVFLWPDNPALDSGQAVKDGPLHLHYSGGLGLRVQIGQSMLVRLDTAFGAEEYLVDGVRETEPTFGLYLVFDHPY